jgi:hypothetical protein
MFTIVKKHIPTIDEETKTIIRNNFWFIIGFDIIRVEIGKKKISS